MEYPELLKLYHTNDRATRSPSDPLRQAKLEAAYPGGKRHPSLSEWDDVLSWLQHLVVEHLRWAGIGPSDLVADDYYSGPNAPARSYERIEGRRKDLRARYERLEVPVIGEITKPRKTALDVLMIMLENGGATYSTLMEGTGLSYEGYATTRSN